MLTVGATVTRGQVGYELAGCLRLPPTWKRISPDRPDLFD
jgi:hypothetical protein